MMRDKNDAHINYQNMMDINTKYKNDYNGNIKDDDRKDFERYLRNKYNDISMNTYSAETQEKYLRNNYKENNEAWNV